MDQQQPPIIEPPEKPTSWHNAIACYMSRRIRHIRASSNEWYRVHRGGSGGRNGGGHGWLRLLLLCGVVWLAYQLFLWIVEVVRSIIHGVTEFLDAVTPAALLILIIGGAIVWYQQHRRGI